MSDRDKFLTEAMGEFFDNNGFKFSCPNCYRDMTHNPDFSTWQGFGKLWEWAVDQEWWFNFKTMHYLGMIPEFNPEISIINPDRFATAIYDYLKPKETP